jgi:N-ethylmaleimide reductase
MQSAKTQAQNLLKNWSDKVFLGKYELKNRIVLSALTRQRCEIGVGIPNDVMAKYYAQRSGAGLLLTESASWSQRG